MVLKLGWNWFSEGVGLHPADLTSHTHTLEFTSGAKNSSKQPGRGREVNQITSLTALLNIALEQKKSQSSSYYCLAQPVYCAIPHTLHAWTVINEDERLHEVVGGFICVLMNYTSELEHGPGQRRKARAALLHGLTSPGLCWKSVFFFFFSFM